MSIFKVLRSTEYCVTALRFTMSVFSASLQTNFVCGALERWPVDLPSPSSSKRIGPSPLRAPFHKSFSALNNKGLVFMASHFSFPDYPRVIVIWADRSMSEKDREFGSLLKSKKRRWCAAQQRCGWCTASPDRSREGRIHPRI